MLVFAFGNALVEELEFRGVLHDALAGSCPSLPPPVVADAAGEALALTQLSASSLAACLTPARGAAVVSINVLFALEHYRMGFPSGPVGAALVFAWGCALSTLRCASGGLWCAYLVHVAADLTIGYLVWWKEGRLSGADRLCKGLWAAGWEQHEDDGGRAFYYHGGTDTSQRRCPDVLGKKES